MGLTNAILAGKHGARRLGEASDWKTLMSSARANVPGIHVAAFSCSSMQRRIGCLAAIAFHCVEVRLGRPSRTMGHCAGLIEILAAQGDGAHRVLGK